jgi:biopolymer transport protein ExbB/TolQ
MSRERQFLPAFALPMAPAERNTMSANRPAALNSQTADAADNPFTAAERRRTAVNTVIGWLVSPVAWALVITFAFYASFPYLPFDEKYMIRYFAGHPIEYVETGMFILGIALLVAKLQQLLRQRKTLAVLILPEADRLAGSSAVERANLIEDEVFAAPAIHRESWWYGRILEACGFVRRTGGSDGLDAELKHYADQSYNRLHDSYGLVQTITWAIPILGFLGTVMGITMAIANLTPEQLESSLNDVTSGLAVAFDTTAIALVYSLILVFSFQFTKRQEEAVVSEIEHRAVHELSILLNDSTSSDRSLIDAEAHAAQELVRNTESLLKKHVELWDDSLNDLRDRWSATLSARQSDLSNSLVDGVALSLDEHRRLVDELQHKVLAAFDACSQMLVDSLESADQRRQVHQETMAVSMQQMGRQLSEHLLEAQSGFERRQLALAESMSVQVGLWQDRLEGATQAIERQITTLTQQGELLAQVVENEEHLVRLQDRLTDNLEAVRAAATFDETLHQLTAAVHLLTTRVRSHAA